jgi:hypothetical protein
MAPELAGSQITALLETVPGIASVLRSPVADAIVNMIRAGAGLADFRPEDAEELVQYAVRRGLIGGAEGDRVLEEAQAATKKRRVTKPPVKRSRQRPVARKPAPGRHNGKPAKKGR